MGNICTTTIDIYGKDAKKFSDKVDEWIANGYDGGPGTYGKPWLGNICKGAGIDINSVKCRGEIYYREFVEDDNHLIIEQATDWCPMLKLWDKAIKSLGYDLEIIYSAEESGSEIYWTNDPALVGELTDSEGHKYEFVPIEECD